ITGVAGVSGICICRTVISSCSTVCFGVGSGAQSAMISVASFGGYIYADQFSRSRTAGSWKESCHAAGGLLLHCRWHCRVFCLKTAVHTTHDTLPEPETEIRIVAAFFVVIIASPYRTGIVGGISAEPEVLV